MTGTVLLIRSTIAVLVLFGLFALIRWLVRFAKRERLLERQQLAMEANKSDAPKPASEDKPSSKKPAPAEKHPKGDPPDATLPIVIMARTGKTFSGAMLANLIDNFGLTYSPNKTYELIAEDGDSIFCTMLNVRTPGTLPSPTALKTNPHEYEFEGILLILQLPVSDDPVKDWETFSALVYDMTEMSNGRLCDYTRRPIGDRDLARYKAAAVEFQTQYLQWLNQNK